MTRRRQLALPIARADGLLVEQVGDETVVLDTESHQAHCLSPLAAAVFGGADGRTRVEDIAGLAGAAIDEDVSVDQVEAALAQLDERGLLDRPALPGGISRRALVRRTAVATAAVAAAPLVTSIVTPAHGQTASAGAACPRAACASQGDGDPFCGTLGCPPPDGSPRDSCECELCCILLSQGRVSSCPYQCNGTTPVNPPACEPGVGGCRPGTQDRLDGFCIQRVGDTTEPCAT
jgi:hypothetical protein